MSCIRKSVRFLNVLKHVRSVQATGQLCQTVGYERTQIMHYNSSPLQEKQSKGILPKQMLQTRHYSEAAQQEETYEYEAEVDRLMDMIVNSLYSKRDVFVRELVSNGSDALDKQRLVAQTDSEAMKANPELDIKVKCNNEAHTVSIEDSGIGMTHDELISSLGTIARSGTLRFMQAMNEQKGPAADSNLIGQFGVGFYSSFLVAQKVKVVTRSMKEGSKQWVFESDVGSKNFTIKEDVDGEPIPRGTRVTLFLKDDAKEFSDPKKMQELIKQYDQFISFPVKLWSEQTEYEQVVDEEKTATKQEKENEKAKEEDREPQTVESVMKSVGKQVWDWRIQNDSKPIWARDPKTVSIDDYNNFFKATFNAYQDPLCYKHFHVEGNIEFNALLYFPTTAPFDEQDWSSKTNSIRLYVRRVFISDSFDEDLIPRYLRFVRGVVDSWDLPLNVSREILQKTATTNLIKKQLVRKIMDMMTDLAKNNPPKYAEFWENFGKYLKVGVVEDQDARQKLAPLLRFYSSKHQETVTGLDEYVDRMKENQNTIYYMAADNKEMARTAPFVEKLVNKDYEVLYFVEPIDEIVAINLGEYKSKKLVDVSRENVELEDEEEKKQLEQTAKDFEPVTEFMKDVLMGKVEKVIVSSRLVDSPCIVATTNYGWSANMERLMRAQQMADARASEFLKGRKIMEINPNNHVVIGIKNMIDSGEDGQKEKAKQMSNLMFETALITSGFSLDSPKEFANKIFGMMSHIVPETGTQTQQTQNENLNNDGKDQEVEKEAEKEATGQ
eukprot:TRINITY_DN3649_c0_g1_i4.p1 TRINITY_DN3649_c0_g1~~TRINITY_DN3649_c0_g1_i4.p1  ORF type:complete len:781 (-),score=164.14 TRINITY_DN3649_c0_g1_i4:309-2651(-)